MQQKIQELINNKDRQQGDTVIHELVLQKNTELLQEWIKKGCRIFTQSSFDGCTPLHRAA